MMNESHHYNSRSIKTGKLELIESDKEPKKLVVRDFTVGARIRHSKRGEGTVTKVESTIIKGETK